MRLMCSDPHGKKSVKKISVEEQDFIQITKTRDSRNEERFFKFNDTPNEIDGSKTLPGRHAGLSVGTERPGTL